MSETRGSWKDTRSRCLFSRNRQKKPRNNTTNWKELNKLQNKVKVKMGTKTNKENIKEIDTSKYIQKLMIISYL